MNAERKGLKQPHDLSSERGLIGAIIVDSSPEKQTLVDAIAAGASAKSFTDPDLARVFVKILELHRDGLPIEDWTIIDRFTKDGRPQDLVVPVLNAIISSAPTSGLFNVHLKDVLEAERLRELIKVATETVNKCYEYKGDFDQLINGVERDLLGVIRAPDSSHASIWSAVESRRVKATKPPPEPTPRFHLAGKVIATPGNLCNFIAKAKSGKTAGIGAVIASAVAASLGKRGLDTLQFTASNPDGKALVVIDTEQSNWDAHRCLMRALGRAEEENEPTWLHVYGLAGYTDDQLCAALPVIMENVAKTNGGIFALCLDGVADFVPDVNDAAASKTLVAKLQSLAIAHDCSVLNVIHSNEGKTAGNDGRGHLGKELARKGESNLFLMKSGDVTTITSDIQRNAPITEQDGVAFKWSDEHHRHVSCASLVKAKDDAKRQELSDLAAKVFNGAKHMSRTDLEAGICTALKCALNTGYNRVVKMISLGVVKRVEFGQYERVT